MKQYIFILSLMILSLNSYAQLAVIPGSPDTVNYTHVLFEVPYSEKASEYAITIEAGDGQRTDTRSTKNYLMVRSGISFNKTYSWKYSYYDKSGKIFFTSEPTTLFVRGDWMSDSIMFRNVVTVKKEHAYTDGYILLDNGCIIDRNGKTVWTFPKDKFGMVRNLELNKDGTLSFIWNAFCYETDLRGNVLWKSPDSAMGYKLTDYHHEVKKLDNGNYLCIARRIKSGDDNTIYSIVFETDKNNNLQWIWDEKEYYRDDSNFRGSHLNAAYYDVQEKMLYLSNRDLSSITKINTTTGDIVYSIGYRYTNGAPYYPQDFFSMQHAVSKPENEDILFFNNNARAGGAASSVIIMSQPSKKKLPQLKWEYVFDFENKAYNFVSKRGDVDMLPDGNLLVCMGANNRTFEITKNKEIVWQTDGERYDTLAKKFIPMPTSYRAAFSTSLYPCYFTAHIEGRKLVIENAGTQTDRYTYRFVKNGKTIKTNTTRTLRPAAVMKIKMPGVSISGQYIEVISVRNNTFVKKVTY